MSDEITKIIKIEASGGEKTVKSLKREIEGLRDALLNTEKGSEDYKKILEQLISDQKKLADAMSAGKNEVSAATGSYNALKNEMSALKKVWAEVTDEASRGEIGKRIEEINTELKEMDASIGNFQRNVGNYAGGFKNARQELAALKTQMDNLQEGTDEYNAAFQRAADITHTMSERQEMLKYSAADLGTQLSNVASIGSSLVGGFNAINSVIALTGDKSEELQETMMRLQAGIALVQGLQGLEGMTKRMKGFVEGVTSMIFKTNEASTAINTETTAVQTNTAAQGANTTATMGATVATKAFGKALIATGIGAIVVLIGTLIAHWDDLKEAIGLSSEQLEKFGLFMDKARAAIVGVANTIGNILLVPIKNAIAYVQTLGNVIKDVFTLNFSKIGDDIKEGFEKVKQNVKKGYDVVGNYQEAFNKRSEELSKKRAQKNAKASAEEMQEVIKDNEAKNGSDWKYTEEGKKMYDEYFQKKLAGYKKDSKEYKEAQREMWSYEREFNERKNKAVKDTAKNTKAKQKEVTDNSIKEKEREEAEIAKIQRRAELALMDAKDAELAELKDKYDQEVALYTKYQKDITTLTEEYDKKRKDIEDKYDTTDKDKQIASDNLAKTSNKQLKDLDYKNGQDLTKIELEYSWKQANGSLTYDDIIEENEKIYEANKTYLEEQAKVYESVMNSEDATDEQRLEAQENYERTSDEIKTLALQRDIQRAEEKKALIKQEIQMYQELGNAIADIFGSIADLLEEDIKAKIKNGEITQEEGEKQFEQVKALQIAQATIQTIAGAVAAFMGCQETFPGPWGLALGAIQAAAVTAAGVVQIAKIKSTQLGGGGSSAPSSMSAGAVQTAPEEYMAPYTQNATGESEIVNLANSIKDQKVYVVESDITEAQDRRKVRVQESSW